jgi:hypothetical protein
VPETVVNGAVSLVAKEWCGGAEENGSEGVATAVMEWRPWQCGNESVVAETGVVKHCGKMAEEKACVPFAGLLRFFAWKRYFDIAADRSAGMTLPGYAI